MTRWQAIGFGARAGVLHVEARAGVSPSGSPRPCSRRGAVAALELALLDRREHQREVALLAARELLVAVDQDHAVLLGERQRVLDRRVAGADHDDRLVLVLVGIVELVLDDARSSPGHAELAQVALQADGEDHVLGRDACRRGQRELERALRAADAVTPGAVADVDLVAGRAPRPTSRGSPRACRPRSSAGCASGRIRGSAITCLPFWYFWSVPA